MADRPTMPAKTPGRYSGWQMAFFILLAIVISVLVTGTVAYQVLFPKAFTPVALSDQEQQRLDAKLRRIEGPPPATPGRPLEPEPYSEAGASREIAFTEKELNALLANNTDLAQRLAIDLSDNLASARLLVPVDPDIPVLGGKTVRLSAGLELAYAEGRPIVLLKGVSLWGVPLPNAWLGGMKNVDLVREFGNEPGFWRAFAEGVERIEVKEGKLHMVLKK